MHTLDAWRRLAARPAGAEKIVPQLEEVYYWLSLAVPKLKGEMLDKMTGFRNDATAALTAAKRAEIDERVKQLQAPHQPQQ